MEQFRIHATNLFRIIENEEVGTEFIMPLKNIRFANNNVPMIEKQLINVRDDSYFRVAGLTPKDIKFKYSNQELVCHMEGKWYIIDGIGV